MKKFFVLFCIPAAAIQDWMTRVPEAERNEQSRKMMEDWHTWLKAHDSMVLDKGRSLGKTKRVTAEGIQDVHNDLNWYLLIQADSHEAAAELFKDHPHLQIPTSYIEIIESNRDSER